MKKVEKWHAINVIYHYKTRCEVNINMLVGNDDDTFLL